MRRPFLSFILIVVLPCSVAMGMAWATTASVWADMRATSAERTGRLALGLYRHADGSPSPSALDRIGRLTAERVDLYRDGRRAAGGSVGEDATPPEVLSQAALARLASAPGRPVRSDGGFLIVDGRTDVKPTLVARVVSVGAGQGPLARPVGLVVGLLVLFSVLTAWIQLARPAGQVTTSSGRASALLLALIPTLTVIVLVTHVTRRSEAESVDAPTRDASRALTAATIAGVTGDVDALSALTGLDAARVRSGRVVASTTADQDAALAAIPTPPPSFIATGRVVTSAGRSAYAATRLVGGGFVVLTVPIQSNTTAALRKAIALILGSLAFVLSVGAWWMLRGGAAVRPLTPATINSGR